MPNAAWLQAAKSTPIKPVLMVEVESYDAVIVSQSVRSEWEAGSLTRLELFDLPGGGCGIRPARFNRALALLFAYPSTMWVDAGERFHVLGIKGAVYTGFVPPATGHRVRFILAGHTNGYVIAESYPGSVWTAVGALISHPGGGYYTGSTEIDVRYNVPPLFAAEQYKNYYAFLELENKPASAARYYSAYFHDAATLQARWESGSIVTSPMDLGAKPTLPSRFYFNDVAPGASSIIYAAEGRDNVGDSWTQLGAVVDGSEVAAYRYYRIIATLTCSPLDVPEVHEIRLIGGNAQSVYLGTHRNVPAITGANVLPLVKSVSSSSFKIDLKDKPSVGDVTITLQWTKETSELVQGYGRKRAVAIYLGFEGLNRSDYEPYFTGFWDKYTADPDKREFQVSVRDVWKRFKKKVPDEQIVLGVRQPISYLLGSCAADPGINLNIIDAISKVAELSGVPDRFLDRAGLASLKASQYTGAAWNVYRRMTKQAESDDLLVELQQTAGLFLIPGPDGKLAAMHYDSIISQSPAFTLDAGRVKFTGLNIYDKTYTRYLIYHGLLQDTGGKLREGGNKDDYGYVYLMPNADAEKDREETVPFEFMDKWGMSASSADGQANALTRLADRLESWFTPITTISGKKVATANLTVQAEGVPLSYYGLKPGMTVYVDNLRIPCPQNNWGGFTDKVKFLVLSRELDTKNWSLRFGLFQVAPPTFRTAPNWSSYPAPSLWGPVENLTVTEFLGLRLDGTLDTRLRVEFDTPSRAAAAGFNVWVAEESRPFSCLAFLGYDRGGSRRYYEFTVSDGLQYRIAVATVQMNGRGRTPEESPYVDITVIGKALPPSDVAGLASELTRGQLRLTWDSVQDLDLAGYEIQLGTVWDDLGNTILVTGLTGTSFLWPPASNGSFSFLIKAIDTTGHYSTVATSLTVSVPLPAAVTGISVAESLYAANTPSVIKSRAVVTWTPVANAIGYDVEIWGPANSSWVPAGRVTIPTCTIDDTKPGWTKIHVRAINDYGVPGNYTENQFNILGKTAPPSNVTGIDCVITRGQLRLFWDAVLDLDVAGYEVQLGTVWDAGGNTTLIAGFAGTSFQWTPNVTGTISFLIKAIDTTGHFSAAASRFDYAITGPRAVDSLTQKVIDNIVELHWEPGTSGTLPSFPVDYYELYRGLTVVPENLVGRKYGTFDLLSETVGGTYKYWVVAVDIAGLKSSAVGVYATVAQPSDYVLQDQQNINLASATLVNAILDGSKIVALVNTSETFGSHFTTRSWDQPSDQTGAGYAVYAQPGASPASIEKVIDYGATIPGCKISMSVTRSTIAGTVTVTPQISISSDNSNWTVLTSTDYEIFSSSFRYVKYRLNFSSADGGIVEVTQIAVKLDVKQRTAVTKMNVADTVSDGTQVLFSSMGIAPVDVVGIMAEAPYTGNSTNDPIKALINFVDAPYPTSFKVLAWNKSGTRVAVNDVIVTVRYI